MTKGLSKDMIESRLQPIGVFDSGVGGLSVLHALVQRLPSENFIYFGDTGRTPYGDRTPEEIRGFNREIGSWLLSLGCKLLIVACNTSTVLGMDEIKAMTDIPVIGMMDAIISGTFGIGVGEDAWPIGFIATKATVDSGAYQKAFSALRPASIEAGESFFSAACPALVPLVESGKMSGQDVDKAINEYMMPLKDKRIRTLILGCTHYPFLTSAISQLSSSARNSGVKEISE